MPGVFRRAWFPRPRRVLFSSASVNVTLNQTGVEATTQFGSVAIEVDASVNLVGVAAQSAGGGVVGDQPAILLAGVQATAAVTSPSESATRRLFGVAAVAQINADAMLLFRNVNLIGLQAIAIPHDESQTGAVQYPAGGGGGGAAGLFGNGEDGQDGQVDGTGGYGGSADGSTVPRQLTPGANGNDGTEFNGLIGTGSGGAGGSYGTVPFGMGFVGQDGGVGGFYGGGGGGGGGGPNGGGSGGVGQDGIVFIQYMGDSGLVTIILDKTATSPFIFPPDWSLTQNQIILVGPGGCGSDGTSFSGGNGGFGGDTVGVENTTLFNPGDSIDFSIPTLPCTGDPVRFSSYAAGAGGNGGVPGPGSGEGGGSVGFPGGIVASGGKGGPGGILSSFFNIAQAGSLPSVQATAQVGSFILNGVPSDRVFIVGGVNETVLPPGTAMYQTSDTVNLGADPYIVGPSQYLTIGQVSWGGHVKQQGTNWEFVDPVTMPHVIHLLTPPSVGTSIDLVYTRWNIGVTAGFEVTAYPVSFSFFDTTIIADAIPPVDEFFTVNFTKARVVSNPQTFFSRYSMIIDDMLTIHNLYDAPLGYETYRPTGYTVLDLTLNQLFIWDGTTWGGSAVVADGTLFYVKRLRGIYEMVSGTPLLRFRAGDTANPTYPEALTYPPYGDGIGKNLLERAFAPDAQTNYPAAYEVSLCPGDFDPWVEE